jgi:hypothetical protein
MNTSPHKDGKYHFLRDVCVCVLVNQAHDADVDPVK